MMVNQASCDRCDYSIDYLGHDPDRKPLCPKCHDPLEFSGKLGCVFGSGNDMRPDAKDLVDRWRAKSETTGEPASRFYEHFAMQLEDVLVQHGVVRDE